MVMSAPPVIAFTPVPLRPRADGWPPELQRRFIVALAQGLKPGQAARLLGKNRQNAYALRKRPGGESFAAAWDAAVACALDRRRQARQQRQRQNCPHGKPDFPDFPQSDCRFSRGPPLRPRPC
jgi:hypothetical protein